MGCDTALGTCWASISQRLSPMPRRGLSVLKVRYYVYCLGWHLPVHTNATGALAAV